MHVSDTSYEHLGLRSMDIMFTYDNIADMIHDQDKHYFKHLDNNFCAYKDGQEFSFYSLWFVSKIKRNEKSLTEYKVNVTFFCCCLNYDWNGLHSDMQNVQIFGQNYLLNVFVKILKTW